MAQKIIDGDLYDEFVVRAAPGSRLPVDVGGATVNITGDVTVSNEVEITNEQDAPIPASVASLPLPAGAATSANQSTLIGHVDGIESLLNSIDADTGSIDGKLPALSGGRIPVRPDVATRTPTTTSVASSATSVTILAANSNRRGVSIANDSTAVLRLSFATPATSANAFIVMQPGSFLLLDQQLIVTNIIYGIWASANGTAQVTEYI